MSSDLFDIPIFPLGIVLFPQSRYPLHIFEERYRIMIRECLDTNSIFGINLSVDSEIRSVGCTARVTEMKTLYPDGRMDVVVEGENRYELTGTRTHPDGYLVGSVRYLPDEMEEAEEPLREMAAELFRQVLHAARAGRIDDDSLPRMSAYAIAEKAGMEAAARQSLLEERSERRRMRLVADHLRRIIPRIEDAATIRRLAMNDGYLPRRG
jgi:ATP-dependent Lon protease